VDDPAIGLGVDRQRPAGDSHHALVSPPQGDRSQRMNRIDRRIIYVILVIAVLLIAWQFLASL